MIRKDIKPTMECMYQAQRSQICCVPAELPYAGAPSSSLEGMHNTCLATQSYLTILSRILCIRLCLIEPGIEIGIITVCSRRHCIICNSTIKQQHNTNLSRNGSASQSRQDFARRRSTERGFCKGMYHDVVHTAISHKKLEETNKGPRIE